MWIPYQIARWTDEWTHLEDSDGDLDIDYNDMELISLSSLGEIITIP